MARKFHIVMFPWFAVGHMTPYLHLSNELAKRGHKISFLLPNKAQDHLRHLILHPTLMTFHPLTIPHVDGLPLGAETASDVPIHLTRFLATALDLTRPQVEQIILGLQPDFVFYDFAYWIPQITTKLEIKSVSYNVVCAATLSNNMVPARYAIQRRGPDHPPTAEELATPPAGFPSSTVVLRKHEAFKLTFLSNEFGLGITFFERLNSSMKSSDAIALRTCREIEGQFCDYLAAQFEKPVLLTGPVLPDPEEPADEQLDERWASWLGRQEPGSVIYCAFGSQFILDKDQFQEILLGFELTGRPFLAALKPPTGCSTVEEAMPSGFEERVRGKGVVHGGWVQQRLLLAHPAVGCFVSHCGFGSMWESLMSGPQIVLVPQLLPDQILNTRMMAVEMKVAVEVEREDSGWVSRQSLSKAVNEAMDDKSEVGCCIRKNHDKWREVLGAQGFTTRYVDEFVAQLDCLL